VAPIVFLPIHARLSEPLFWGLLGVTILPAALLMLQLDRSADRPERLRGRTLTPPDRSALGAGAGE
jgi:hypothetical protein